MTLNPKHVQSMSQYQPVELVTWTLITLTVRNPPLLLLLAPFPRHQMVMMMHTRQHLPVLPQVQASGVMGRLST
jgi:hypothetical protein